MLTDFPEPVVEVWDDNWDVLLLYNTYRTQWRVGAAGAIGLDFNVFHHALDRKGITDYDYDQWISNLCVIESAALTMFAKQ